MEPKTAMQPFAGRGQELFARVLSETVEEEHQSPPEKKPKHEEEEAQMKKPMLEGGASEQNPILGRGEDAGDESSDEEESERPRDYLKYYESKFPESMMKKIRSKPEHNPDIDYCLEGHYEVDWDVWNEYYKQIEETEGFGVKIYPGCCPNAYLRPIPYFWKHEGYNKLIRELTDLAIKQFNGDNNDKEFKVVDIEWVVDAPANGIRYYITFTAEDSKEGLKTFEAKVLDAINYRKVELCRIKKVAA